jgi:hypothetical protein
MLRSRTSSRARALALFVLICAPSLADAQSRPDSLLPPAGSWGVEGSIGGYSAATLLRLTTPRSAWLLGASFGIYHSRSNFGGVADAVQQSASTQLRLGRRWWRGAAQSTLQPLLGAGVTGGLALADHSRQIAAGLYAEAGATYFLVPRVGLSGVGEMNVRYLGTKQFASLGGPGSTSQAWTAQGYLIRSALVVFF